MKLSNMYVLVNKKDNKVVCDDFGPYVLTSRESARQVKRDFEYDCRIVKLIPAEVVR